ncbi:hypothetical protein SAMN04488542_109120 [Fontibacillus panacisegetis]|uniref:Uncharacterized protein n=1 Tax=Fontibacillus panacisegetis TaxID=670482 RepID=A0A1G7KFZ5_9BACL|nr:hypothetical protein [Fontibacillus panacisegetis]SDF35759.1 hypothetical protein SAMN04488542_109120 [Fontibacillus panacisegetis]
MSNRQGRYNKLEVERSGLPVYIPRSSRLTSKPYRFAVLMSKSRCQRFDLPVNRGESPAAFLYAANAGTGTNDLTHRYYPLFDRTEAMADDESARLYPHEIMQPD